MHGIFDKKTIVQLQTSILLYVDDLLIRGGDLVAIKKLKSILNTKLEMKDMDEVHYFLDINVIHTLRGILLCQHNILNLLSNSVWWIAILSCMTLLD